MACDTWPTAAASLVVSSAVSVEPAVAELMTFIRTGVTASVAIGTMSLMAPSKSRCATFCTALAADAGRPPIEATAFRIPLKLPVTKHWPIVVSACASAEDSSGVRRKAGELPLTPPLLVVMDAIAFARTGVAAALATVIIFSAAGWNCPAITCWKASTATVGRPPIPARASSTALKFPSLRASTTPCMAVSRRAVALLLSVTSNSAAVLTMAAVSSGARVSVLVSEAIALKGDESVSANSVDLVSLSPQRVCWTKQVRISVPLPPISFPEQSPSASFAAAKSLDSAWTAYSNRIFEKPKLPHDTLVSGSTEKPDSEKSAPLMFRISGNRS